MIGVIGVIFSVSEMRMLVYIDTNIITFDISFRINSIANIISSNIKLRFLIFLMNKPN